MRPSRLLLVALTSLTLRAASSPLPLPSASCPLDDGSSSLDAALSSVYSHAGESHFRVLQAFLDAARTSCAGPFLFHRSEGGQTLFAPTDAAFERLFVILNRGLEELLGNPTFLCGLARYHVTIPCGPTNNATFRRACGFLPTDDIVDGQALETLFDDQTLIAGLGLGGAGTASSLLFAQISQEVSVRKVRVDGYLKRGADVLVPNIVLCGSGLVVHVVDAVLVPAAAFYSSVDSLIASSPELSITAEAYFLTAALRESLLVSQEGDGVTAQQEAIVIPPLFPSGTLPNPVLPDPGMCVPGEVIDAFAVKTVFAPTNLAWKNFFRRVGLSKEQVFSDLELLLSTLQYSEVFITEVTPPIAADGVLAGSRWATLAAREKSASRQTDLGPALRGLADTSRTTCTRSRSFNPASIPSCSSSFRCSDRPWEP